MGVHVERAGVRLAPRSTEGVDGGADRDVDEAGLVEQATPVVDGLAAGDAPRPEVDRAHGLFGQRYAVGDVGELDAATGPEGPEGLGEDGGLVGAEVDDAVGDDDVRPAVVNG